MRMTRRQTITPTEAPIAIMTAELVAEEATRQGRQKKGKSGKIQAQEPKKKNRSGKGKLKRRRRRRNNDKDEWYRKRIENIGEKGGVVVESLKKTKTNEANNLE